MNSKKQAQKNIDSNSNAPNDQQKEKLEKIVTEGEQVISQLKTTLKEVKEEKREHKEMKQQSNFYNESGNTVEQRSKNGKKKEIEKFNEFVLEAPKPILKISAVFPLDLFPDTLIADPVKITQIHRIFFWSNQVRSITVKDIKFVVIENGPIFSTLRISDNMLQPTVFVIKPLWKKEACKAHDVIQGLIQSAKQNIDTTKITPQDQVSQFEELGKPKEEM